MIEITSPKSVQIIKVLIFSYVVLLINVNCHLLVAQNRHSIYLIGDAGEDKSPGKTLRIMQSRLEKDSNSTVVFLGDNAYPDGINKIDLRKVEQSYLHPKVATLYSQLTVLRNYRGNVFFIPGNHDWKAQKKINAFKSIKNESIAIESFLKDSTQIKNEKELNFIPIVDKEQQKPMVVDITTDITIVFFDSQWFFQRIKGCNRKKKMVALDRFFKTTDSIISLKEKEGRKIIIASHHPVYTNGYHSRKRQPLRFIFNYTPFWLLGKLGVDRWLSQDITQPFYKKYILKYNSILEKHKELIVVAGHDHNLQFFEKKGNSFIVSGAGSKSKKLNPRGKSVSEFQTDKKKGFVKLSFNESLLNIEFISEDDEILFSK